MQTMDKVMELSKNNKKSVEQIVMKMAEETGEVSQAVLSYLNANGSSYKGLDADDVMEECTDVIIVALSLVFKLGGDKEYLEQMMKKKVAKWEEKSKQ